MKKALKIIVPILLVALGIFYLVSYIVWKDQTTYITECIINFINKPVVIAGVSTTIGGLFGFLLVKYIINNSKFGKKRLHEIEEENEKLSEKIDYLSSYIESIETTLETDIETLTKCVGETRQSVIKSFELSKNIKVKELAKTLKGEQPYGEEEVDSQEETETL